MTTSCFSKDFLVYWDAADFWYKYAFFYHLFLMFDRFSSTKLRYELGFVSLWLTKYLFAGLCHLCDVTLCVSSQRSPLREFFIIGPYLWGSQTIIHSCGALSTASTISLYRRIFNGDVNCTWIFRRLNGVYYFFLRNEYWDIWITAL